MEIYILAILLLFFVAFIFWIARPEEQSPKWIIKSGTHWTTEESQPTIFVSIASYRDPDCGDTIRSLIQNAHNPSRIHLGIYQQNSGDQAEQCLVISHPYIQNVEVSYQQASGPMTARGRIQELYGGQDYFYQIDSHTDMVQDWDCHLIRSYHQVRERTGRDRVVLTSYPLPIEKHNRSNQLGQETTRMKPGHITRENMYIASSEIIRNSDWSPVLQPVISGGNTFAPGSWVKDAYFDRDLHGIFEGEEMLIGLGSYQMGWEIYPMPVCVCRHYFTREDRPHVWDQPEYYRAVPYSQANIRRMIGVSSPEDEALLKRGQMDSDPWIRQASQERFRKIDPKILDYYRDNFGIDLRNKKMV